MSAVPGYAHDHRQVHRPAFRIHSHPCFMGRFGRPAAEFIRQKSLAENVRTEMFACLGNSENRCPGYRMKHRCLITFGCDGPERIKAILGSRVSGSPSYSTEGPRRQITILRPPPIQILCATLGYVRVDQGPRAVVYVGARIRVRAGKSENYGPVPCDGRGGEGASACFVRLKLLVGMAGPQVLQ